MACFLIFFWPISHAPLIEMQSNIFPRSVLSRTIIVLSKEIQSLSDKYGVSLRITFHLNWSIFKQLFNLLVINDCTPVGTFSIIQINKTNSQCLLPAREHSTLHTTFSVETTLLSGVHWPFGYEDLHHISVIRETKWCI